VGVRGASVCAPGWERGCHCCLPPVHVPSGRDRLVPEVTVQKREASTTICLVSLVCVEGCLEWRPSTSVWLHGPCLPFSCVVVWQVNKEVSRVLLQNQVCPAGAPPPHPSSACGLCCALPTETLLRCPLLCAVQPALFDQDQVHF
jgi:hypothetical protein